MEYLREIIISKLRSLVHHYQILFYLFLLPQYLILVGCGAGGGDEDVLNSSFGLNIQIVSGNNQIGPSDSLFEDPAVVKVVDASGKGVKDIEIVFTQPAGQPIFITNDKAKTDSNGLAQTSVRSPLEFDSSGILRACILGSNRCVDFNFNSDDTSENIKLVFVTENNGTEVAGVPFSIQVKTVDDSSGSLVRHNGDVLLEWNFITENSWGGFSPTLLPGLLNCTFVEGICDVNQDVILTNSREPTRVFMGDGDGGFIDTFGVPINIVNGPATHLQITNGQGGPDSGAETIQDTVFSADDSSFTFFAAITDSVGNYIEDSSAATWSSTHAPQITNNLSTTSGESTTLTFQQSIPFPSFGRLHVDIPGYVQGETGALSIDPGEPVMARILPLDMQMTRTGGESFAFEIGVYDAHNNIVGQQFGSSGFTGTFPTTFTFSDFHTGPIPSGGVLPMVHLPGSYSATDINHTINVSFFAGKGQFIDHHLTFFDATNVNPQVSLAIDSSSSGDMPPSVTGDTVFSMQVGPPSNLMLRNGLGPGADSLCPANYTGPNFSWDRREAILSDQYLQSNKGLCSQLVLAADELDRDVYLSIEDAGGNFIANITGQWIFTNPAGTDSLLLNQFSGPSTSVSQNFNPQVTTNGPSTEWIRVQASYDGTDYDQYFRAQVLSGVLDHFWVRVVRRGHLNIAEAPAPNNNQIVLIPLDQNNNFITQSFSRDLNITVTGSPNNSPDGNPPSIISSGFYPNLPFAMVVPIVPLLNYGDQTAVHIFENQILPNAGDQITLSVTAADDPTITGSATITSIHGPVNRAEIWRGNLPENGGIEVTNLDFTMTADESTNFFAVAKDAVGNRVNLVSNWITWDDTPQPFNPANSVSGIISGTLQTPFVVERPGTGSLRLRIFQPAGGANSGGTAIANTGLITLLPGAPQSIAMNLGACSSEFVAGTPCNVTAEIKDAKSNTVTSINGPTDLSIGILQNSSTRLNFSHQAPTDGSYSFTNGTYSFTGSEAFAFYNAEQNPRIQIATTAGSPIVGQSPALDLLPDSFDHLALIPNFTEVSAGDINRYTILSEDLYGNTIKAGADSEKTITFNITSVLGTEDIVNSNLLNASIGDFSPPGQKSISGDLELGVGWVETQSTKSGTMTVSGTTSGIVGVNTEAPHQVLPLTTIQSVRFRPGEEPPSLSSTISQILPFRVEVLDAFDNVITSNNSEIIHLDPIGATQSFTNYNPVTVTNGNAFFNGLSYTLADSFTLRAYTDSDPSIYVDAPMTVESGSVTRTVVVLPGQTFVEGTGSLADAVVGDPFGSVARTAGDTFSVDVRALDSSYNTVTTYTGAVSIASSDPFLEVTPASQNFVGGVATFNVKVRQMGDNQHIYASTGFTNHNSSSYDVNYNSATQLVALLPGQNLLQGAPDRETALDLLVPDQTAGVPFDVQVLAVDDYFNHVDNYSHPSIALDMNIDAAVPNPANLSMSAGSITFSAVNYLATNDLSVTPSSASAPALSGLISKLYNVRAANATQFIAVFPGQTRNPGQAPGDYAAAVTGTPSDQSTDAGFAVNLYAVDDYFNTRLDYSDTVSVTTLDDPTDTDPGSGSFASGIVTFSINPVTAGNNQRLGVTSTLSTNTPAEYNVTPGSPTNLITLFTDYQTLVEGNTSLTDAVADQTVQDRVSGETVNVRVYATDSKYNIVDDSATVVSIAASTPNHNVTPTSQALTNGVANFDIATYLVGSGYQITPSGGSYAQNNSTAYNTVLGPGLKLLVVLPNQTFSPGQATAAEATVGAPFSQTEGADFPFQALVYATDEYFNHRTSDTATVTLTPSLAHTFLGSSSVAMVGGIATFDLYHTASGNAQDIVASSGGYTTSPSEQYDVISNLVNPGLTLRDPTTLNTDYIRQATTGSVITSDATVVRWCVSETQSSRPSSGTNDRGVCNGGGGSDDGWYTNRPTSVATSSSQGSKTLYIWTSDIARNVNMGTVSDTIALDSVLPANPAMLELEDQDTMSPDYTDSSNINLSVNLSVDTEQWCVIEQPLLSAPPSPPQFDDPCWATAPTLFPQTWTLGSTGTRSLYVFSQDIAQNVSADSASASITYDNTAPVFPAGNTILGVRGGQDTVADEWLGTTTAPTIDWVAATDETALTYTITIKDSGSSEVCGTPVTVGEVTSHSFSSCTTHGQTYTIEIVAEDSAGQTTAANNNGFSFTVDTLPPGAFSVTGLQGGTDTLADNFLTDSLNDPRVDYSASSDEAGYEIRINNDTGATTVCGPETAAAASTSFQSFSGCTLADNTDYQIQVIAFDLAGNTQEATNSPFSFRTSEGVDHFDVELLPASNPVAGNGFSAKLTARRANNEIVTAYSGVKTMSWSTTSENGVDVCNTGTPQAPEFPGTSLSFTSGEATTTASFRLKLAQLGRTITATEQDTSHNATGTSATFNVEATTLNCVRIEDQAGGIGSPIAPQTLSIDQRLAAYAAGYDVYGNYLSDESVTWSGAGVITNLPYPIVDTQTSITGVKSGTGQLIATGVTTTAVNLTVSPGNGTLASATVDGDGNQTLGNDNVSALFVWDIASDSEDSWLNDGTKSWHSESASGTRGEKNDFPLRSFLVATTAGLDIVDATNNNLYMRFNKGLNKAIPSGWGNIQDVAALNGKIYISMHDGGVNGGLIIIDFINDEIFRLNGTISEKSNQNIANRNLAATWSADAEYPLISGSKVHKIFLRTISTVDYLALSEETAINLLRVSGTKTAYKMTTTNPTHAVALDSSGKLYFSENSVGVHRSDLSLPLASDFSTTRTYNSASEAEVGSLTIHDISLGEGTSSAQSGRNSIIVATNEGLTAIQEHDTLSSSTSLHFGNIGSGQSVFSNYLSFPGTDGYVNIPNGGSSLTNTATYEMWVKPSSSVANKVLLQKGTGEDGSVIIDFDVSGELALTVRHNSADYTLGSGLTSWNNNQWYHIAATIDSSGLNLWVDGQDHQSLPVDLTSFSITTAAMTLGGTPAGDHFHGSIDELRVSSNLRYSSTSFTVPSSAFVADGDTVHLLHFDQTSGSLAEHSDTGAQEDGTLNNDVFFIRGIYNGANAGVLSLDTLTDSGRINTHFITNSGWFEIMDLQGASPFVEESDLGLSTPGSDVKIYHRSSATSNDSAIGLSSGGLYLRRR